MITAEPLYKSVLSLAKYRSKEGFKVGIVFNKQIKKDFGNGKFSPASIRKFLRFAYNNWQKPKLHYVVLIGDSVLDRKKKRKDLLIPSYIKNARVKGFKRSPKIGTDNLYAQMDDKDEIPDIAIGRLPADSEVEAKVMVDKIVRYEKSKDNGLWRKKINLLAAPGRFGKMVDSIISKMFTKVVSDRIPYSYDINLTYASTDSPYCYLPEKFNEKVIEEINKGSLILAYVGHGQRSRVDDLMLRGKRYPVLNLESVKKIRINKGSPIVFILACHTGRFDSKYGDSIGEELVKHKFGPVAVFASSRISSPYCNAILGKELVEVACAGKYKRLGDALLKLKDRLVNNKDKLRKTIDQLAAMFLGGKSLKGERLDHLYLYNLIGDPALKIKYPDFKVKIKSKLKVYRGENFKVRLSTRGRIKRGKAILTVECKREMIIHPLKKVDFSKESYIKIIKKNYKNANNKIAVKKVIDFDKKNIIIEIKIPKKFPNGTYYLKCFLKGKKSCAVGYLKIEAIGPREYVEF